ncbi:hypothetical protein DGG96_03645 [Legionella qingyii]|uniref:Uncharacterized protein n=1 Tax=Legionella qingyii TaxID=2184757 RepID=A0A317U948_9GAMM|nr:hypothetical protein [Legionella qingyii]PWY57092.1 hypothetical protein DGG96_03645 [Legionella qingyii]
MNVGVGGLGLVYAVAKKVLYDIHEELKGLLLTVSDFMGKVKKQRKTVQVFVRVHYAEDELVIEVKRGLAG